jgi:hypothetical protein
MNRRKKMADLDDDPLSGVANLFDVAMIFAIGLLVVALTHFGVEELITQSDVTIVKNPGQENMQVIIKQGDEIEKLEETGTDQRGDYHERKKVWNNLSD